VGRNTRKIKGYGKKMNPGFSPYASLAYLQYFSFLCHKANSDSEAPYMSHNGLCGLLRQSKKHDRIINQAGCKICASRNGLTFAKISFGLGE
jgi:hypothetical protein